MICILNYISSIRRLKESQKTIDMMVDASGDESGVSNQLLAQRDMIEMESIYYKEKSINFCYFLLCLFIFLYMVCNTYLFNIFEKL